jgi:hypothetical protein
MTMMTTMTTTTEITIVVTEMMKMDLTRIILAKERARLN